VWGEVVEGLRAALEIVPKQDSYPLGEPLDIQFRIRNASRRTLKIASDAWRQGDVLTATDENGESVEVGGCWYSGWSESKRETLKPGQTAVFKASGLAFVTPDDADRPGHPVGKWVECKPGRYTLQFQLGFPDLGGTKLDIPQQGEAARHTRGRQSAVGTRDQAGDPRGTGPHHGLLQSGGSGANCGGVAGLTATGAQQPIPDGRSPEALPEYRAHRAVCR